VKKNVTLGYDFGQKCDKKCKKNCGETISKTCLLVRSVIVAVSDHDLLAVFLHEVVPLVCENVLVGAE